MSTVISFENVSFQYDKTTILKDVSFSIEEGDFVGIIGPNGGGKTTLLRLLLGFLTPTSGEIHIFGTTAQKASKQIAYMPQTLQFDPLFPISVLEVVLTGLLSHLPWWGHYRSKDKQAALESLEQVGMADFAKQRFGTLSTGQAQRVLIARALVSNPKLLLLDEPTACVDVQSETAIQQILKSMQKEITILMVTHDLPTIINDVQKVFTVHGTVSFLDPKTVCDHFSLGLYHSHNHGEEHS